MATTDIDPKALFELLAPILVQGGYLGVDSALYVAGLFCEVKNVPLTPWLLCSAAEHCGLESGMAYAFIKFPIIQASYLRACVIEEHTHEPEWGPEECMVSDYICAVVSERDDLLRRLMHEDYWEEPILEVIQKVVSVIDSEEWDELNKNDSEDDCDFFLDALECLEYGEI